MVMDLQDVPTTLEDAIGRSQVRLLPTPSMSILHPDQKTKTEMKIQMRVMKSSIATRNPTLAVPMNRTMIQKLLD